MTDQRRAQIHRILAIDPTSRGFGFAVLEGATRLIDWGTRDTARADSEGALRHLAAILKHYHPDVIIAEDTSDRESRRRGRARNLIASACSLAESHRVAQVSISRRQVVSLFAGRPTVNKRTIATAIAGHFPELSPRVPPVRKAWMSEDTRTSIFDAVAFALVFYFQFDDQRQERIDDPRH